MIRNVEKKLVSRMRNKTVNSRKENHKKYVKTKSNYDDNNDNTTERDVLL